MAVPRADEVFPSDARSAGKGKKRKRGDGSGVERSTEETSDVPPSGEPRKKKKKRRTKKKSAGEQLENADEPIRQEEEDAREEELQPEEGASEAEASEGRNDEEGVSEGEERETSLNAARSVSRIPLPEVVAGQEAELRRSQLGVTAVRVSSSSFQNPIQTLTTDIVDVPMQFKGR
ncbi:hypothetical protein DY000_02058492 [Brassica cretica]|uniref:Uncharacterized protein n=1 Tax=Brassica cretica TaxID=69181 RepID=A0ABQ7AYC9_BRACR|nr:hypothetical protein DY000_02058492 [Brassica cretica]